MGLSVGNCTGAYNRIRNFDSLVKKESAQWVNRFGKWGETEPMPSSVWKNAHKMEKFDTFTKNILNDVKDYKLRTKLIEIQEKVNKLIKDGRLLKDGPENKSLQETIALSSHLDSANDRLVCDAIAERLDNAVKLSKFNDVSYLFENVEQLASIPVHSKAAAVPLQGRVNEMHNFFKKNSYPSEFLNKAELDEAYKTQNLVDFLTGDTVQLSDHVPVSNDLNKHLYRKYYLSRQNPDVKTNLGIIEENFGTKTFVPLSAENAQTDDLLREFYAWNAAGGKNVNHENVLDYTNFDRRLYGDNLLQGGAGGFASIKNFIRLRANGLKVNERNPALRHEKMHRNDLNRDIRGIYPADYGHFGPNKQYDFTKNGEILTKKQWYRDEFKNAGVREKQINYAYTDRAEFLAVAAEGNPESYSPEFRQVLIDLGMPPYFFKMRKFKTYNF